MPQTTIQFSVTADFEYGRGITNSYVETKTVTWTLDHPQPLVWGRFLDQSPWVVWQSGLKLVATTPVAEQKPVVSWEFVPFGGGWTSAITGPFMVDLNNTVINPDVGKSKPVPTRLAWDGYDSWQPGLTFYDGAPENQVSCDGHTYRSNADYMFMPFDGRSGVRGYWKQRNLFGEWYDYTQKWNRQPKDLNVGDFITVAVSRYIPLTGHEATRLGPSSEKWEFRGIQGGHALGNMPTGPDNWYIFSEGWSYGDVPIIDMYGFLTVVSQPPPANSYRPPCNWDPADRANAPIFQENDTLESFLTTVPPYSVDRDDRRVLPAWFGFPNPNGNGYSETWSGNAVTNYLAIPKIVNKNAFTYGNGLFLWGLFGHSGNRGCKYNILSASYENVEYGGVRDTAYELMVWTMLSADSEFAGVNLPAATPTPASLRKLIRTGFVQRGIDMYGARKSLGKGISPDGGHQQHYIINEVIAYLVTKNTELLPFLEGRITGNTANGSFISLEDNNYGAKYSKLAHCGNAYYTLIPPDQNLKQFQHGTRWNKLKIKQVVTGTPTSPIIGPNGGPTFPYGPEFQIVRVEAPDAVPCGQAIYDYNPNASDPYASSAIFQTGTGSWNLNTLSNNGNPDLRYSGRWNATLNTGYVAGGNYIRLTHFTGSWLRRHGTNQITRIIANRPISKHAPNYASFSEIPYGFTYASSPVAGDYHNNSDMLFWTKDSIFQSGDQYVDLAPLIVEDIAEEPHVGHVTYGTNNSWGRYGAVPYKNFAAQHIPFYKHAQDNIIPSLGIPLPRLVKETNKQNKQFVSSEIGLWSFGNLATGSIYNTLSEWYLALMRKYWGTPSPTGGYPQRLPWPTISPDSISQNSIPWYATDAASIAYYQSFAAGRTASVAIYPQSWQNFRYPYQLTGRRCRAWDDIEPATKTWIETYTPPPNITVVGNSVAQSNNESPVYKIGETVPVGGFFRSYWAVHPDPIKREQGFMALTVNALGYGDNGSHHVPYSNANGINYPLFVSGKTLYLWFNGQSIPIKLKRMPQYDVFATGNPSSGWDFGSWQQTWELPGSVKKPKDLLNFTDGIGYRIFYADEDPRFEWTNPEPPEYDTDLNNDGRTDALDLAILLGNIGKSGSGILGDINGDGIVDNTDLSILLNGWGSPQGDPRLLVQVPQNEITIRLSTTDMTRDATWTEKEIRSGATHSADSIYPSNKVVPLRNPLEDIDFLDSDSNQAQEISGLLPSEEGGVGNGAGGVYIQNSAVQTYFPDAVIDNTNVFDVKPQTEDFYTLARQNGGVTLSFIIHGRNDRPLDGNFTESNEVQYQDNPDLFDVDFYKSSSYISFKSADAIASVPKLTSSLISFRKHPHKVYFSLKKTDMQFLDVNGGIQSQGNSFSPGIQDIRLVNPLPQDIIAKISLLDETSGLMPTTTSGPPGRKSRVTFNEFDQVETATAFNVNLNPQTALCESQASYWKTYQTNNTILFAVYGDIPIAQRPIFQPFGNQVNYGNRINSVNTSSIGKYTIIDTTPEQTIHIRGDVMPDRGNKNLLGYQVVGSNPRLFGSGTNNLGFQVGSYVRVSGTTSGGQNDGIYQVIGLIDGIDGDTTANTSNTDGGSVYQYLELSVPCEGDSIIPEVEGSSVTIENVSSLPILHVKYQVPVEVGLV